MLLVQYKNDKWASAQREFNNPRICFWAAKREKLITRKYQRLQYHVSVDCQESYIFARDYIFPEVRSTEGKYCPEGNITILAPPIHDISSFPVDICYIRWSKWMISSKFYVLYDYHEDW